MWNSKLNDRCLFLLESLDFTGPASAAENVVHELIIRFSDHAKDLHGDIGNILVNPTLVNKTSLSFDDITKHFRASEFRRVGDSKWLARSIDENHVERRIPETSDSDQCPPLTEYELLMKTLQKQRTQKAIKNAGAKGAGGKAVENSDNFKGYSASDVQKLLSLRGITASTEDEANQAKYGCTCGLCLGGFISPRMAYILSQNSSYNFVALVGLVGCESHSQEWQCAVLGGVPFCGQTDITTTVAYKCWKYIPGDAGKLILTLVSKDAARGHYQVRHAGIIPDIVDPADKTRSSTRSTLSSRPGHLLLLPQFLAYFKHLTALLLARRFRHAIHKRYLRRRLTTLRHSQSIGPLAVL